MSNKFKIGIFGTGLETYWPQFEGLLDKLVLHKDEIVRRMKDVEEVEVVDAGLVDNAAAAFEVASLFTREEVGLVFLYVATYSLSSTVLPVVRNLRCPVVILNLQPTPAINYDRINSLEDRGEMTGLWLENCQACSIPEIACVLNRTGIRYDIVTGFIDDKDAWKEIGEWIRAARVFHSMRRNRLGILGRYYGGMVDVYSDITFHSVVFGTHMEILEICELSKYHTEVTPKEIEAKIAEFRENFEVAPDCEQYEIERAARTSVALDKLVEVHDLGSVAYYYEGMDGNGYENISTSVIAGSTLLTGKGIPIAGECEVKNAHAMKIMSLLGAGGSFSEFYAMDFNDDIILLGHDGPAHFAIAEGRVGLVPLPVYHGKPGKGLSIQMSVKHGPVTLLSVCEGNDGIFLLAAEGESVPGPTLQIGNTNSRYHFSCGVREFMKKWSEAGPSHHCAIGVGHHVGVLRKIAMMFDIPITVIG